MSTARIYYFGCVGQAGHYMFSPGCGSDREASRFTKGNPWGYQVDGGLCPTGPETEGRALVHHKDGWTALSFWDRSVDMRGNCSSTFLAEGTFTFAEMVELARQHFPKIMGRFAFPVVDAQDPAR